MDFISNQNPQIEAMLQTIGIDSIAQLFEQIPRQLLLEKPRIDDGMSEHEGKLHIESLASKNQFPHCISYLGAGAYEHQIPSLVHAVCSKSEFLTSYTPYQAEASQGMLQSIFEFQSALCALTGMDASNASLYDGATACAEAVLMALRLSKGRTKVVIATSLHPSYRKVVEQYLERLHVLIEWIPFLPNGTLDQAQAMHYIDSQTAAVLLQSPNFLGVVEEFSQIRAKAKECEASLILCANPLAYGLYASASEIGADIAVGDAQPFGIPLQYGGPYVGYIACRQSLVRQLPGRVVGETTDALGRRGFVLTLQAREQQIRREKATSNICTNQALAALAALVSILWYGKEGVRSLALTNFQRASYLKSKLSQIPGVKISEAPIFNEFAVAFPGSITDLLLHFRRFGIEPGFPLGKIYSEMKNHLLVAVTEIKSKERLDHYVEVAKQFISGQSDA